MPANKTAAHLVIAQIAQIIAWLNQTNSTVPDWSATEWQLFQQAAFIHGVAPLLHSTLKNQQLPELIQEWLAKQHSFNQQRISRMQAELQAILAQFSRSDVALVPLKGALLTAVYYQDPAQRPTADLDLLIRPEDLAQSLHLLTQLGYEVEKQNWKHAILSRPANRTVVSFEVEHPDNPRRIDLHTTCREMFSGPVVDLTADLWATVTQGQLLGEKTYLLSPEMLWRHLLLHSSNNIWNGVLRLINLIDLFQLEHSLLVDSSLKGWKNEAATFSYPALSFCQRYFPKQTRQGLLAQCEAAVPPPFQHWLAAQDIVSRSRLRPESKRDYLNRLFVLYRGRPHYMVAAARFLLSNLKRNLIR